MAVVDQVNMELHLKRESPLKPVQLLIPCGTRTASCPLSCSVQCSPLASPETKCEWMGRTEGKLQQWKIRRGRRRTCCGRFYQWDMIDMVLPVVVGVLSGWCASPCQCDSDLKCNWPKWPRLMMDIILGKNDRNMLVKCYYGNVGRGEQEQEAVDPSWGDL